MYLHIFHRYFSHHNNDKNSVSRNSVRSHRILLLPYVHIILLFPQVCTTRPGVGPSSRGAVWSPWRSWMILCLMETSMWGRTSTIISLFSSPWVPLHADLWHWLLSPTFRSLWRQPPTYLGNLTPLNKRWATEFLILNMLDRVEAFP